MGGMCPELWGRDIPSVKKTEMSIPLQCPVFLHLKQAPIFIKAVLISSVNAPISAVPLLVAASVVVVVAPMSMAFGFSVFGSD